MKIVSWNVNGIRACVKKGFMDWLAEEDPDVVCLQEIKALPEQLLEATGSPSDYHIVSHSADRKGYSGVSTFSKLTPVSTSLGIGTKKYGGEGRMICSDFGDFLLYNVYFPKGEVGSPRLDFKLGFYRSFLTLLKKQLKAGRSVIVCGDWNTCHKEIDIARPKANQKVSGFLPEERAWIDKFLKAGFVDAFRDHCSEPEHYSWWSYRAGARPRNIGWRLDYFLVSKDLRHTVDAAFIRPDVHGSDHCPVGIVLDLS